VTPRTSAAIEASRLVPTIRVSGATPEQLRAWRAAAALRGMKLAAWIRAACDAAIDGRVVPEVRDMSEAHCRGRTLGAGYQDGFEAGVRAERARST